jgi:hypothetical protein
VVELELVGSTPSQLSVGLKRLNSRGHKELRGGQRQLVNEAWGDRERLTSSRGRCGAVDVAGSCISVRLFPEVARYAITRPANFNTISLLSLLSFLQHHRQLSTNLFQISSQAVEISTIYLRRILGWPPSIFEGI